MKDLILVRGVPGAGKSIIADIIKHGRADRYMIATDDYFTDRNGNYNFDGSKLIENHAKCRDAVEFAMNDDYYEVIIVHNTFTEELHMKPYFDLAAKHGWRVHTVIVENRHGSASTHDVPQHSVDRMKKQLQDSIIL